MSITWWQERSHPVGTLPRFHPPTQEATAVKLWRSAQWVSSDPSARAYGLRAEALAKEDTLRRVPPKTQKGPRLSVLRSSLLRRMG